MSYVSLLKNIPEILSQPTGIAAIASLGIHGAIALIVPLMPVDSHKAKDSDSSKAVGVMELSQADQQRLPQTSPQPQFPVASQFPLPSRVPLNLGDQATALSSLPPPASTQMMLPPPIPRSLDQYRVSALPKGQSLQIVPRGNFRFDTSGFNVNRKFSASVPSFNDRDIKLGEGRPLPIDRLPTLPGAKIPDGLPDSPSASSMQGNPATQTTQPGKNGSEIAQNEQLIAPIDKTPQAGDKLALASESLPQWQRGSTSKIPNELLPRNTTEQALAQVNSYENLRKTVQLNYPNAEEKAVIRDTISTDKPGLEGTVLGGLVIDPDGKVLEIKFQDKSASPDLLLKARQYFIANPPKGQTKTSYYPFRLQFQNKTSNNAGATQEPAPTPAATTKPLSNSAVNSKQPAPTPAATTQPLSNQGVNSKQPIPAATTQPLTNRLVNSKQPAPTPTNTDKPLSASDDNKNDPVTVVQPDKKLIQQLRDLRKQTESSDQEK